MLSVSLISAATGGALWMSRGADLLVWILLLCGVVGVIGTLLKRADGSGAIGEPDDVSQLSDQRRQQLIRGTSMHLRNMRYRYTVRAEHHDLSDRQCFNAEVNSLHLGFVPVVIGDSTTPLLPA